MQSKRLHLSTRILGATAFCVLVLLNIPGEFASDQSFTRHHGWPTTYLVRYAPPVKDPVYPDVSTQTIPSIWSLTDHVERFRPVALIVNIVAVISITLGIGFVFHRWRSSQLRYGIKSFGFFITFLAVIFAWAANESYKNRQRISVISRIESLGGSVEYCTCLPEWLDEILPEVFGGFFLRVVYIDLSQTDTTDSDLKGFGQFRRIRCLDLEETLVVGHGLRYIADCEDLEINLTNTQLTADGIALVSELQSSSKSISIFRMGDFDDTWFYEMGAGRTD